MLKNDLKNEIIIHKDYAIVVLYNSKNEKCALTKIDLEDVDRVSKFKWGFGGGYAQRRIGTPRTLSRFIMGLKEFDYKILIDHTNRDKLDNRKKNLRITNYSVNGFNSLRKNKYSTGIYKNHNKFSAKIVKDKKRYHLGSFPTVEEAIEARKKGELKLYGELSPCYK